MNGVAKVETRPLPCWLEGLSSADGLFVTDVHQRILLWSPSAERMFGRAAADVLGRRCFDVVTGVNAEGHPVCREDCPVTVNARRGRVTPGYDVLLCSSSGERTWLSTSILLAQGQVVGQRLLIHLCQRKRTVREPAPLPALGDGRTPPPSERPLSRREVDLLRLVAAGSTPAEIATELQLSPVTVRNHLTNVQHKLGARNRLELVLFAMHHHLV